MLERARRPAGPGTKPVDPPVVSLASSIFFSGLDNKIARSAVIQKPSFGLNKISVVNCKPTCKVSSALPSGGCAMGTKMSNAPVYYALAQVRFNTIALLDQYVPKIQDTLRKAGYPDFQKMVVASISVSAGAGENQIPAFQQQVRYQFLNENKNTGFILEPSSISFQTTDYDTFVPFSATFFEGLRVLHDTLELSYSERIGMRMLDAVSPREGEKLSHYLTPTVLGLSEELGEDTLIHSVSETRTQRGKAILVSRAVIQRQTGKGVSFAPELHPVQIEVAPKFREITGIYGIIDTDSWIEERMKFEPSELEKTLNSLHDEINLSFTHMVTPHALDVWK